MNTKEKFYVKECLDITCFNYLDGRYCLIEEDVEAMESFNKGVIASINTEIHNVELSEQVEIINMSGKYYEDGKELDLKMFSESEDIRDIIPRTLYEKLDDSSIKDNLPFKKDDNGRFMVYLNPYVPTSITSLVYSKLIEDGEDNEVKNISMKFAGIYITAKLNGEEVIPVISVGFTMHKDTAENGLGVLYTFSLR